MGLGNFAGESQCQDSHMGSRAQAPRWTHSGSLLHATGRKGAEPGPPGGHTQGPCCMLPMEEEEDQRDT